MSIHRTRKYKKTRASTKVEYIPFHILSWITGSSQSLIDTQQSPVIDGLRSHLELRRVLMPRISVLQ